MRVLLCRLIGVFRRRDAELDEEVNTHLELLASEHMNAGMDPHAARRAARRAFGSVAKTKDGYRDQRSTPWVESLLCDVRYAARAIRSTPGFAAVTILTLAVAIGANSSIFTLMRVLLWRQLPVTKPEELVDISLLTASGERGGISLPLLEELDRRQDVFSAMLVYAGGGVLTVEAGGGYRLVTEYAVSGNFHHELGGVSFIGRLLTPSDVDLRAGTSTRTVVLGYGFWNQWFDADPGVVGRELRIEGHPFTIVGVTRPGFGGLGLGEPDITLPLFALPPLLGITPADLRDRARMSLNVVARLKPGVTVEQARAWLDSVGPELLRTAIPEHYTADQRDAFLTRRFQTASAATGIEWFLRSRFTRSLYLLLALVMLLLLIASVHLAGLMVARTTARSHDLVLRLALGASRWRVGRQLFLESLLLSLSGAALGLVFAAWSSSGLAAFMMQQYLVVPRLDLAPDHTILGATAGCGVLASVLIACASVWLFARQESLTGNQTRARVVASSGVLGKGLIAVQVALSVVVLIAAGLLVRTLATLQSADAGFQSDGVLLTRLMPRPGGYNDFHPNSYYRDLLTRLRSLPGVEAVGFSRDRPGNSYAPRESVAGITAELWLVSPGFFETVRMQLVGGRDFMWTDDSDRDRVAIVSRNLAARLFPGSDPIGRQIPTGGAARGQNARIVGVVEDAHVANLRTPAPFVIYVPAMQSPQFFRQGILLARTSAHSRALRSAVSGTIDALGREYPFSMQTLDEAIGQGLIGERLSARLAGFFAVVALMLAAIGLYALTSYSITRRTREIGLRMALGAERRSIEMQVMKGALVPIGIGLAIGVPASFAATQLISSMLVGVGPQDPITIGGVAAVLMATGVLASLVPARRAARVDPMVALRCE